MSSAKGDRPQVASTKTTEKFDPSLIESKWPHSAPRGRFTKATRGKQADDKYQPSEIEPYWQSIWENEKVYQPNLDIATSAEKFYNLNMFPYPSAEGLHVGNMYAFTGGDIYGRFRRMQGKTVFQPIGLDGFGIHSENYALKVNSHPMEQADKSEQNFYRQLRTIGNGYDWSRTVETWKPDYYRWTQWVFTELFKAGLAYRAASSVNWCPSCKTVLADEQVLQKEKEERNERNETKFIIVGVCERCDSEVEKRQMEQWFFRITSYSERLLKDLDKIDWTEKVKIAQRNWIGKSEGARVRFRIVDSKTDLSVFTTRPDTLHGATFMVISPEHPLVAELLNSELKVHHEGALESSNLDAVRAYVEQAAKQSDKERRDEAKEKTGVFSGAYAINPVNNQHIPIWIADYVLMGYGTGAIMAVPAHDQRDFEFAKKYNLPIISVIEPKYITKVGDSAVKENLEYIRREAVCAIIRDPKTDKYLCISWKAFHMNGLVTGGVEDGEDPVTAATREIHEETGYKHVRFIKDTGVYIHSLFYHRQKKQNRWARFHYLMFELENDERDAVSEKEKALMDIVWKTRDELREFFSVVEGNHLISMLDGSDSAFTGEGVLGNSGEWDGWETSDAKQKAIAWLEQNKVGQKDTNYHLRDWLISRQRYWGAPIPMIFCDACAKKGDSWFTSPEYLEYSENQPRLNRDQSIRKSDKSENLKHRNTESSEFSENAGWYPEENLPVLLPNIDDYRPLGTGKAPLANHPEFYETTCPGCSGPARRETDVADTFLDSGWYFLRYPATDLETIPFPMAEEIAKNVIMNESEGSRDSSSLTQNDKKQTNELEIEHAQKRVAWLPVNQYIGGAEHSVLHLLYSRFIYKVFCDLGYIDATRGGDEPFPKFFAHGLIIKDGAKMSKSKGNVVVPDVYIQKYGADTLRTYLMFLGPYSEGGDFQDAGIDGVNRYLKRVWKLLNRATSGSDMDQSAKSSMHRTIKGVTQDLSSMRYNTAIAELMTWYNALASKEAITDEEAVTYLKLLAPFAPHMTEELFQTVSKVAQVPQVPREGKKARDTRGTFKSIHTSNWPEFDEAQMVEETVTIAIQVNGKLRETLEVSQEISDKQQEIEQLAKASENVQRFIEGKEIKKVIFVPGKILNLVI